MQCNVLRDDEKIDALYGGATPEAVGRIQAHLRTCPACREEMKDLERTRERLGTWSLPQSPRPQAFLARVRPWALPAAAAVLLALGGALLYQGSEVRHEAAVRQLLAAQEARHAREIAALRAEIPGSATATPSVRLADVQSLIRESEARQGQRFFARLDELRERSDAQRRIDMARVSAGLSYLDGKNGQQMARTSELMNSMLQVSYKR